MDDFESTISRIRESLKKGLPGFEAQNRMAPSSRMGFPFRKHPNSTTRQSAVLICIYPDDLEATTILIKRSTYNGPHSGQVSFPGGKYDESDESLVHTALREAQEEVGIDPSGVEVIGCLTPLFIPVTNMQVLPVVGKMLNSPTLHPNLQEVEYPICAKLSDFKNPLKSSVKTIKVIGFPVSAPYYSIGGEHIWGATAMIISEFTELY
jgi:8-oxo-dGTP pyrophosphatase MutT (NUDIX family)